MNERVATGFDLEPLANGNVLIEFFGDDGKAFNTQVVTREVIEGMPAVVGLTLVCMDQGPEAVKKIMESIRTDQQDGIAMNPVAQEILNAVDKIVPFAGRSSGGGTGSATVVVELGAGDATGACGSPSRPETHCRSFRSATGRHRRHALLGEQAGLHLNLDRPDGAERGNPQGLPRSWQRQWAAMEVLPSPD